MRSNNKRPPFLLTVLLFTCIAPSIGQAQPNCLLPPAGLVSWWSGNGDANDAVGENNGILQNGATYADGKVGKSFIFNGSYSDVVVAADPSLNITGAITIDAWINPTVLAGMDRTILAKHDSSVPSSSYQFTVQADGRLFFSVYDTATTARVVVSQLPVITVGVFTHVAATFNPDTQDMRFYVNGSEVSVTLTDNRTVSSIFPSTTRVRIGATMASELADAFAGLIDEVDLFARELSAGEIRSIYDAGTAGKCLPASSLNRISFQGALTESTGQSLSNGSYQLTFRFYDGPMSPLALATSNVPKVTVVGGIASTALPVEAAWFDGHTRYLGISIGNGPELSLESLLTAVPRALIADHATVADSLASPLIAVHAQLLTFDPVVAQDPENGTWSIQPSAFHPGNFGIVRSAPTADQSKSLIITPAGQVGIGTATPGSKLDVRGTVRMSVCQITGGADLAEHLSVTDSKPDDEFKVVPGMVVSIDPSGNRKFKLAEEPYDRKRVGIISGGNGVKPGLVLRDEGNPQADGEQPIALTGQVWCHADATFGPITPGDLLTTSSTPGHAMKVSDDTKARFAVLGQALTGLKEGRGWVQVLVGKQ